MLGVVIGRFQVHEIHDAHMKLLETVQRDNDSMLILLGCPKAPPNNSNPLGYVTRQRMLYDLFPNATILPVYDCPTNREWSKQVDQIIASAFPMTECRLYGGQNSFIEHYEGGYDTRILDWGDADRTSGTSIRQALADQALDSVEWRAGVIWATAHMLPRTYHTVDIAYIKNLKKPWVVGKAPEVLLARRSGARRWRFPGGFVDPAELPQHAARRELHEETTFVAEHDPILIGQQFIDDWRSRGQDDVAHLTHFYLVEHCYGALPGKDVDLDDVLEVAWFDIASFNLSTVIEEEHRVLMGVLIGYLQGHISDPVESVS